MVRLMAKSYESWYEISKSNTLVHIRSNGVTGRPAVRTLHRACVISDSHSGNCVGNPRT